MELSLVINSKNCVGCHACEISCKQEHNLPVGPRLIKISADGPRQIDGKQQLRYKAEHCLHCNPAPCKAACPVNAISTRPDGVTIIDARLCNGCKACITACPFGVMRFDDTRNIACKCDLCAARLDRNLQPACVVSCPSHCVYFGEKKKIKAKLEKKSI